MVLANVVKSIQLLRWVQVAETSAITNSNIPYQDYPPPDEALPRV